ncbi:MAG: 5'/3'-nucleotidase SurE [Alphaproteobacteria bacterium]
MRILICNDDGIDAPGIGVLFDAARLLSEDVWLVAPDGKRTAAGPSITVGRPLVMREAGPRRYACSGTPADCVVTAMTWLFEGQARPDLVLSGINDGRNVAEDLAYSGTLGIAREASFWGIPAIGFSRVKKPQLAAGDRAWLGRFIESSWNNRDDWVLEGHWLSVNLPQVLPAAIRQPRIGRDKIALRSDVTATDGDTTTLVVPRGRAHASEAGDENDMIDRGHVCVNRLNWFGESKLDPAFLAGLAA